MVEWGRTRAPAPINDDLSGGACIEQQLIIGTFHTRARCTLNSYGYFCEPRSAGLCNGFLRAIRNFGRGRNGVTLSGNALPHELDQGQRETLAVGQPAEQHVDLRKAGLVRNLFKLELDLIQPHVAQKPVFFIRQVEAA